MGSFGEKMQEIRIKKKISQTQLAEMVGVSRRSIFAYENGTATPRQRIILKIASSLGVTTDYLTNPDEDDIHAGQLKDEANRQIQEEFGSRATKEFNEMGTQLAGFFAGGDVSQEDKDALFEIIMTAYVTAKREARERYTPKSKRKTNKD